MARVLEGQMAMFGLDKADRYKAAADEWVRKNPKAWAFIKNKAVQYTYEHRKFGMGELAEEVRWHMKAQGVDDFKVNNTHRAYLARRLVAEYPQCEPYIEMRKSRADIARRS